MDRTYKERLDTIYLLLKQEEFKKALTEAEDLVAEISCDAEEME